MSERHLCRAAQAWRLRPRSPDACAACQNGLRIQIFRPRTDVVPYRETKSPCGRRKILNTAGHACPNLACAYFAVTDEVSLLRIVQPETLLRWHRELFKHFWKKKSGTKHHPRKISDETLALIRQMAEENRLWGAERIRGELLKLGITVAKRTIQKYLPKERHPTDQTWATFLKNHTEDIFVCDFTVVHDLCFRPIYLLIVMHLATRQIKHFNLTRNPSEAWMAQQMREISAWDEGPRFLICDNDAVFGETFEETAMKIGSEVVHTPFYTPQANRHCERLVGSVRRECLDHMLIFHERQLRRVVKEYTAYYNPARPHQGIRQKIPAKFNDNTLLLEKAEKQTLFVSPFLNGLHHSYSWTNPPV